MPITGKEATIQAQKYLIDLFGSSPPNLTIEEIEREANTWKITLSYFEPSTDIMWPKRDKVYKEFKIHSDSGEVISMKVKRL